MISLYFTAPYHYVNEIILYRVIFNTFLVWNILWYRYVKRQWFCKLESLPWILLYYLGPKQIHPQSDYIMPRLFSDIKKLPGCKRRNISALTKANMGVEVITSVSSVALGCTPPLDPGYKGRPVGRSTPTLRLGRRLNLRMWRTTPAVGHRLPGRHEPVEWR